MGNIQLPGALEHVINQQVAVGRAPTQAALVELAVMRLVEEADAEDEDIRAAIEAGTADIEAGRYTTITMPDNAQNLRDRLMAGVQASLAAKS